MNLGKSISLHRVKALSTTAGTEVTTDTIDMQGFDGVIVFLTLATFNAANYITAQQSADDSTYNNLEGSKVVTTTDADVVAIDIYKPTDRYIQIDVERGGADTVLGEIYALKYGAHKKAPAHGTNVRIEYHASPAEGTA